MNSYKVTESKIRMKRDPSVNLLSDSTHSELKDKNNSQLLLLLLVRYRLKYFTYNNNIGIVYQIDLLIIALPPIYLDIQHL